MSGNSDYTPIIGINLTDVNPPRSALGASRRVERHAGDDAAQLLEGRCQIIK